MASKEKPKKIGFVGSDGMVYYFLLKCDNTGDLRKEARFIDYANLINTIFENNIETRSRALKLHTYSIVPLSRNTGLIEWVNRTKTIKNIVSKQWKKFMIPADYIAVRNIQKNHGKATISDIWDELNDKYVKDVMWNYFSERFPTPDLMMDARVKFMQSYSAWCIVGYIIGLGDRH